LPIVDGTDHDNNENSDNNGNTFDPLDLRGVTETIKVFGCGITRDRLVIYTNRLVDTEGEGNDSDNGKQDLE